MFTPLYAMHTPLCALWNITPNCTHIKWKITISSMAKYYFLFGGAISNFEVKQDYYGQFLVKTLL
jgi:hypothetical protein